MYLARRWRYRGSNWQLCRTVRRKRQLISERLVDLGADPGALIHYPGGHAWYLDPMIEDRLESLGIGYRYQDLEALLWPFVDPYIQRKVGSFYARGRAADRERHQPTAEELAQVHDFDKRRLFYLRCARLDAGDLCQMTDKLYAPLAGRCRDAREQLLLAMEAELSPREYKQYAFAAFDLGRFFRDAVFSRTMPETLDREKLDAAFLTAYCDLVRDQEFWAGFSRQPGEVDYLARYLVFFFDHEFPARSLEEEFIRNFMNARRHYRPPRPKAKVTADRIQQLFGRSPAELRSLDRRRLTRLFRKRAKKLHPDMGGDHDTFVQLSQVYEELLAGKG